MPPIQNAKYRFNNAHQHRRTVRIQHIDRFDLLLAASQGDDGCAIWLADDLAARLSDHDQVPA